jgi:hypothetical protein
MWLGAGRGPSTEANTAVVEEEEEEEEEEFGGPGNVTRWRSTTKPAVGDNG